MIPITGMKLMRTADASLRLGPAAVSTSKHRQSMTVAWLYFGMTRAMVKAR